MTVSSHTLPLSVRSRGLYCLYRLYRLYRNSGATVVEENTALRLAKSEKHWI